jgi:hypothetical protein
MGTALHGLGADGLGVVDPVGQPSSLGALSENLVLFWAGGRLATSL